MPNTRVLDSEGIKESCKLYASLQRPVLDIDIPRRQRFGLDELAAVLETVAHSIRGIGAEVSGRV